MLCVYVVEGTRRGREKDRGGRCGEKEGVCERGGEGVQKSKRDRESSRYRVRGSWRDG